MKKRQFIPIHFEGSHKIAVIMQVSSQAAKLFKDTLKADKRLKISLEIDHNGEVDVYTDEKEWESLARKAGVQMRVEFLVGGYHVRMVDFSKLHRVNTEDLDQMVEALLLSNGDIVLDMMCGYGAVTERILEVSKNKGISTKLYCCDLYLEQLNRIKDAVRKQVHDIRIGDVRSTSYPDCFFDAIAIKMGVHDVPRPDQALLFDEMFRILKPGGRFVIWEVLTDSSAEQDAFSDQISKKDELAGYESFILDRYFLRPDQLLTLYENSGFIEVKEVFCAHFKESSHERLDSELNGDPQKLEQLNQYIRKCTPKNIRHSMRYQDDGDNISMSIPNRIFRGIKNK